MLMFSSGLAMESMKSCCYIGSGFTGRFSSQLKVQGVYAPVNGVCAYVCLHVKQKGIGIGPGA